MPAVTTRPPTSGGTTRPGRCRRLDDEPSARTSAVGVTRQGQALHVLRFSATGMDDGRANEQEGGVYLETRAVFTVSVIRRELQLAAVPLSTTPA
jgi:hypothetical protein